MPLTPSNGDRHAMPLVRLYKALELALWRWIVKVLGLDGFGRRWLMKILIQLPRFRAGVRKLVDDAGNRAPALVRQAIEHGWADGAAAARTDIGSDRAHTDDRITNRLVDRVLEALDAANRGLPAATEGIFHRAVDQAADADTAQDHRDALDRSLQQDARRGFTALVDPHGRRRELVAYVEAQIRGAVSAAEIEGYTQQLAAEGHDLFVVSDVPGACETCRPFEGKVISITGSTIGAITRNTSTNRAVAVTVMCSLREAMDRGLFHPNCRHTIRVWTPDNPAPPQAVRVSEPQRAARRAVAAESRVARVQMRRRAASLPDRANALGWPGRKKPNMVKVGKLKVPRSRYDQARNATEVGELLASRFGFDVTGFDTPGVDLETAREFARAIDNMLSKYEYVDLRGVHISTDTSGTNAYAWTEPHRDPSGDWYSEIHLNIDYASDPKLFAAETRADAASGHHNPNSHLRPAYSTAIHEFAHALDFNTRAQARKRVDGALFQYWAPRYSNPNDNYSTARAQMKQWVRANLSGYSFDAKGDIEPAEALAEAFEDVEINGDQASEPAKVLYDLLIKMSRRTP
ncbi:phage minor capsid protein [Nocardia sp. NPDC051833]|uniref:phage minor capsid protein n=1 Tax=Nocardia sp. NPDC051833 TaxID=3155674 RepID=UPI0034155F27